MTDAQPNPSFQGFPDGRYEYQRYFAVTGATLVLQASRARLERGHVNADLKAYLREQGRNGLVHLDGDNFPIDKGEDRRRYGRQVHNMLPDLLKGTRDEPLYQDRDLMQDLYLFSLHISRAMNALDARQLAQVPPRRDVHWLLKPVLIDKQPVFLFGKGGAGKSLLALGIGLSVQTGEVVLPGYRPSEMRNVLYLNWETDEEEIRMRQLYFGDSFGDALWHIPCVSPLPMMVADLTRQCHEWNIGLIIVDSLLLAAGGASEEHAAPFFAALRRLGRPSLVVAHTQKNAEDKSVYGSIFFENLARNVFEVRGTDRDGSLLVALYHKKGNNLRRLAPFGFTIEFEPAFRIASADVRADPEMARGVSTLDQIEGVIAANKGNPVSRETILNELTGLNPDVSAERMALRLRKTIHDHKERRLQQVMMSGDPKTEYWALKAFNE